MWKNGLMSIFKERAYLFLKILLIHFLFMNMNRLPLFLGSLISFFFLLSACAGPNDSALKNKSNPKVAILGLGLEASVFSPALTHKEDFRPRYGEEIFDSYPFFHPDSSLRKQADWVPIVIGHAMPGGQATREAYESLVNEILEGLEENLPFEGIYFDIHGAMGVEGMEDPEGDFITRIREVVGAETLISTSMDLHGSVSQTLAKHTDLITAFRMAPHEDRWETKRRAIDHLLDRIVHGKGKPKYKAWVAVPILLAGEQTSTRVEPGKSLYGKIPSFIHEDKMQDVSIWMSYPWGDQARNHGVVVAYGDDEKEVKEAAESLAKDFWGVREEFDFVAETLPFTEAMKRAVASDKKPFIMSDMGDNPTAGGSGDVTWTLQELLKYPSFSSADGKYWVYASIPGAEFVDKALEAGVGEVVEGEVGAMVDHNHAGPVLLKGEITAIHEGENNTAGAVKVGNSKVIVTRHRAAYHYVKQFTDLDIDLKEVDVLVVKQGYLVPELYEMRQDWVMALTPGGVDQDLHRLEYKHIQRPIFPLDKNIEPDLEAVFIPLSDQN